MEITPPIVLAIVCGVAVIVLLVYAIVKAQRRRLATGTEEMIGKEAVAQTALNPKGTVLAEGELWTAIAKGDRVEPGEEVIITKVEGLKLWVTKKSNEKEGE
jgi:membrane-bound ClpP family serine protease